MFCERKAAQMAAYLLHKAGGRMPHMKLMKLMYLADRSCYRHFDRPMSKDTAVSMDYGPVLSKTYDLMKGKTKSDAWSGYISPIENNEVSLVVELGTLECLRGRIRSLERLRGRIRSLDGTGTHRLGKLSRADMQVLDEVYSQYGDISPFSLSELTHEFPEWQNPHGSSLPIPAGAILQAVGKEPDVIEQIVEELEERDALEVALAAK